MKTLDGISTLNLAQNIVKLVYSDEYQQQYHPDANSCINPRGKENWIKLDWLKGLLGIYHPTVTAYMRQIEELHFHGQDDYNGILQFQFCVPNNYGSEDIQQYTLADLLDTYGDLRGAIRELYRIADRLWESSHGEWEGAWDWDYERLQWVPSDKLAAALDKDHALLMDYMILNMLDRRYDEEKWEGWHFFLYDNQAYIGIADHYLSAIIPLEEFLTSPMNYQVIGSPSKKCNHVTQGITLRGVLNGAKLINWRAK